jgi:multiple sugar transport system substrate-binding protein
MTGRRETGLLAGRPTMRRRELLGSAAAVAAAGIVPARRARAATTIQLWHVFNLETEVYMREGVRSFNASQGGFAIEERIIPFAQYRTELVRAIATGDTPDLVCIDNPDTSSFASQDGLLNLAGYVAQSERIDPEVYLPGPWSTVQWRDGIYGIPRDSNTIAVYYSRPMFEAAGLDPENPPATWSELKAAAEQLNDPANRVFGILFAARQAEDSTFQWLPFLWQNGGDIDRLAGPEAIEALEYWVSYLADGLTSPDILTMTQSECVNRFIAKNAAMAISGPWDTPRVDQNADFEWGVALMPVKDGKDIRASALGGWNWCIPAAARHPDAAWQVIEWMARPEQMSNSWKSGRLPPRTDVTIEDPAYPVAFKTYSEQMKSARARGPHPSWPEISRAIQLAIQKAMTRSESAEAALAEAAREVDGILAKTPL